MAWLKAPNKSINYAPSVPDAAKLRRLLRRYAPKAFVVAALVLIPLFSSGSGIAAAPRIIAGPIGDCYLKHISELSSEKSSSKVYRVDFENDEMEYEISGKVTEAVLSWRCEFIAIVRSNEHGASVQGSQILFYERQCLRSMISAQDVFGGRSNNEFLEVVSLGHYGVEFKAGEESAIYDLRTSEEAAQNWDGRATLMERLNKPRHITCG